ncbi:MAG: hypothetical protein DMG13_34635 [Acidobacteria bacterium]|nr:MAG: hypothetical protein DMG13_34635 [Acidobacteriota bacterium]
MGEVLRCVEAPAQIKSWNVQHADRNSGVQIEIVVVERFMDADPRAFVDQNVHDRRNIQPA